jgi:hypothetical protein
MSQLPGDCRGVLPVCPQDDYEPKRKGSDGKDDLSGGHVIHDETPNHTLVAQAQPLMIRNYDRELCSNRPRGAVTAGLFPAWANSEGPARSGPNMVPARTGSAKYGGGAANPLSKTKAA